MSVVSNFLDVQTSQRPPTETQKEGEGIGLGRQKEEGPTCHRKKACLLLGYYPQ